MLRSLVSICTLFTFYMIANGIIFRHYYAPGRNKPWLALAMLAYLTLISLGAQTVLRDLCAKIVPVRCCFYIDQWLM